jgi:hypothetical protein
MEEVLGANKFSDSGRGAGESHTVRVVRRRSAWIQRLFDHPSPKPWILGAVANSSSFMIQITYYKYSTQLKLNSVVLVGKRTIPTERPQPVGEVSANFS